MKWHVELFSSVSIYLLFRVLIKPFKPCHSWLTLYTTEISLGRVWSLYPSLLCFKKMALWSWCSNGRDNELHFSTSLRRHSLVRSCTKYQFFQVLYQCKFRNKVMSRAKRDCVTLRVARCFSTYVLVKSDSSYYPIYPEKLLSICDKYTNIPQLSPSVLQPWPCPNLEPRVTILHLPTEHCLCCIFSATE
jgi:hypothetical protein